MVSQTAPAGGPPGITAGFRPRAPPAIASSVASGVPVYLEMLAAAPDTEELGATVVRPAQVQECLAAFTVIRARRQKSRY
jgi:hypothetical protein